MILQAYDFVELSRRHRLRAADGRLRSVGQHRQRRRARPPHGAARSCSALTTPLLTTASGAKMGKTAAGAVWLNAEHAQRLTITGSTGATPRTPTSSASSSCSPMLPIDEIAALAALQGAGDQRGQEDARDRGDGAACTAATTAEEAAARPRARRSRKARSRTNLPTVEISAAELARRPSACSRLFVKAGLVASNGEARRQIKGGGLRVNDAAVTDERMMLASKGCDAGGRHQGFRWAVRGTFWLKPVLIKRMAVAIVGCSYGELKSAGALSGWPVLNSKILRNTPGAIAEIGLTRSTGAPGVPTTS